jgi:hypothetical protein
MPIAGVKWHFIDTHLHDMGVTSLAKGIVKNILLSEPSTEIDHLHSQSKLNINRYQVEYDSHGIQFQSNEKASITLLKLLGKTIQNLTNVNQAKMTPTKNQSVLILRIQINGNYSNHLIQMIH